MKQDRLWELLNSRTAGLWGALAVLLFAAVVIVSTGEDEPAAAPPAAAEVKQPAAPKRKPAPPVVTEAQKRLAVDSIRQQPQVLDASIRQEAGQLTLTIVVRHATNEDHARQLCDSFVRLVKSFSPDTAPGKRIGRGVYDYIVGVYTPDAQRVVIGAKASNAYAGNW